MLYVVYDLSVVLFVVFYYGMIYTKYIIMLWFIYVIAHSIDTNVVYICSFVLFIFHINTIIVDGYGLIIYFCCLHSLCLSIIIINIIINTTLFYNITILLFPHYLLYLWYYSMHYCTIHLQMTMQLTTHTATTLLTVLHYHVGAILLLPIIAYHRKTNK